MGNLARLELIGVYFSFHSNRFLNEGDLAYIIDNELRQDLLHLLNDCTFAGFSCACYME